MKGSKTTTKHGISAAVRIGAQVGIFSGVSFYTSEARARNTPPPGERGGGGVVVAVVAGLGWLVAGWAAG